MVSSNSRNGSEWNDDKWIESDGRRRNEMRMGEWNSGRMGGMEMDRSDGEGRVDIWGTYERGEEEYERRVWDICRNRGGDIWNNVLSVWA